MVSKQLHHTHYRARPHRAVVGLACIAGAGAAAALCRGRLRRVRVIGDSMLPTFAPGDRLLVGPSIQVLAGQVVAVRDPRRPGRLLVKRVRWVGPGWVDVRGDNDSASTDRRQLGPIPRSHVAGWVIYRYGPPERAGWLPGRLRPVARHSGDE